MRERKPRRIKTSRRRSKATKPSRKELKSIYRGIVNASEDVRAQTLSTALDWYDRSMKWIEKDKHRKGLIDRAPVRKALLEVANWRQRAEHIKRNPAENERCLRKAMEFYERAVGKILRTKVVSYYYRKFEKVKSKVKQQEKKLTARYELLFSTLWEALKPTCKLSNGPLGYIVTDVPEESVTRGPRWFTKDYRAMYHTKQLAAQLLKLYREEGWLAVVLDELPILALAAVGVEQEVEEDGKRYTKLVLTPALALKQTEFTIKMMHNVVAYARKDQKFARRLIRSKRRRK